MAEAITIVLFFVGIALAILLLRDWLTLPSSKQIEEYSRRFTERLQKPDLAALEQHFGHPLPVALVALYRDEREIMRGDFSVAASPDAAEENRWHVAFYVPADLQSAKEAWPGTEKYFAFADDGCGNGYLVNPRLSDPPVLFNDHDTGELSQVADRLSDFMRWPRIESSE